MAETKGKRGALRKILVILVAFGPGIIILLMAMGKCKNQFEKLPVFGEMPTYEFVDYNGNIVSDKTQEGKITLFTTLQTSCPQNCAIDLFKFNLILYQDLVKNQKIMKDVEIISIITDKEGNPIDNLEEIHYTLEDMVDRYDTKIWNIVAGDPKQIYDIENNGVNLYTVQADSTFAGKAYLETLLLVDKQNQLRLVRRGSKEGFIRDFKQNVSLLNQEYHDLEKQQKQD